MRRKKPFSHISIITDLDDKRKEGMEGGRKEEGKKEAMGWCRGEVRRE